MLKSVAYHWESILLITIMMMFCELFESAKGNRQSVPSSRAHRILPQGCHLLLLGGVASSFKWKKNQQHT
uniref:Putative secreted peptide n=1 Tax=Anopheles braziliensis TaxID=58242 RepID=A0A2M3ZVM1_9DIPT